jgi:phosphate/sulfate permease
MVNALQIISIGFAGVAAIRSYHVEEILASLIIFAVLFGCVAAILFLLFMLGRASQAVIAFAELCGRKMRRLQPFFNRKRKDNDPDGMKEGNKKRCTAIP